MAERSVLRVRGYLVGNMLLSGQQTIPERHCQGFPEQRSQVAFAVRTVLFSIICTCNHVKCKITVTEVKTRKIGDREK